jgi:acyl carrier protein
MDFRKGVKCMNPSMVETRLENYIRTQFNVSPTDPGFDREADLFENGYVDSVGVVELLGFLQEEFRVEVPDSASPAQRVPFTRQAPSRSAPATIMAEIEFDHG